MNRKLITKTIVLESQHLGYQIDERIKEQTQKIVGDCNEEYGYIVSVGDFEIYDTEISRATSENIFKLKIWVETLKPEVDTTYKCTTTSCIDKNGIYATIGERLRIRIAEKSMADWKFNSNGYEQTVGGKTRRITVGSIVDVKITAIKYNNGNFLCIGVLN